MKKVTFIIGLLVLAIIAIGCTSPTPTVMEETTVKNEEQAAPAGSTVTENIAEEDLLVPNSGNAIKITSTGFEPKTLTVKAGTTVTFVNEDSNKHWPASAMHPTHTVYPGSDIKKCASNENIFDACKGLVSGESFFFTFNEKGSWGYHDHLRSSSTGKIVVE